MGWRARNNTDAFCWHSKFSSKTELVDCSVEPGVRLPSEHLHCCRSVITRHGQSIEVNKISYVAKDDDTSDRGEHNCGDELSLCQSRPSRLITGGSCRGCSCV